MSPEPMRLFLSLGGVEQDVEDFPRRRLDQHHVVVDDDAFGALRGSRQPRLQIGRQVALGETRRQGSPLAQLLRKSGWQAFLLGEARGQALALALALALQFPFKDAEK